MLMRVGEVVGVKRIRHCGSGGSQWVVGLPGVLLPGMASGIARNFPAGVCGSAYCFA